MKKPAQTIPFNVEIPVHLRDAIDEIKTRTSRPYTKLVPDILELGLEAYKEIEKLGPAEILRLSRIYREVNEDPCGSSSDEVQGQGSGPKT